MGRFSGNGASVRNATLAIFLASFFDAEFRIAEFDFQGAKRKPPRRAAPRSI
jgi:hypothetical protein